MPAQIVVLGSLNMDFVVKVDRLPAPGETALGSNFQMIPGGKGANQACAVGRIGGSNVSAWMIGRVGYDVFADHLKASLSAAGVDVSTVHATRSHPTGVALIWVDAKGQNSIVVASGANFALEPSDVEAFRPVLIGARYALFQLETPLPAVAAALALAHQVGTKTILDPAPAQPLSSELLSYVDILTPNETEACILLGRAVTRVDRSAASKLAKGLLALGVRSVVLKLGDQGCFYTDGKAEVFAPSFPVQAIDSTAAGDIFNASLAVALAEDQPIEQALRFANAAAALSVTRAGAQSSVPLRSEVDAFLKSCAS